MTTAARRSGTAAGVFLVLLLAGGAPLPLPARAQPGEPAGAPEPATLQELWQAGELAFESNDVETALRHFNQALEMDPDQPRTWNYLGGVHFVKGDYLKSLLHFKQAYSLNPGDARACNNIGTAYEHLDQFDKAEQFYLRAIEIDGGYAVPYRNLGVLYAEHLKRPNMAKTYWKRFIELSPSGPDAQAVKEALQKLTGAD